MSELDDRALASAVNAALRYWNTPDAGGHTGATEAAIRAYLAAAPAPTVSEPKIRPMETLDEAGRLIARAHVHEDCAIVLYGTNDKPIGWIDTHAWLKGRVYRDHLDPSPTVSGEPVAWRWRLKYQNRDEWTDWQVTASRRDYGGPDVRIEEQPLYTHPAPTRAEVLEECQTCNGTGNEARASICRDCDGTGVLAGEKP